MTQLIDAVKAGDSDLVKQLLYSPIDVNAQDEYGLTALHVAVTFGLDDIVSVLLEHPDIDINSKDLHGNTPLLLAFSKDDFYAKKEFHIAQQLIDKPAVNVNAVNNHGVTALYLACFKGQLDYALAILKRDDIDVNYINLKGDTALHACIFHDPYYGKGLDIEVGGDSLREKLIGIQMAKGLLAINPDLINIKNHSGKTVLHYCAKHGEWELVSVLLRYPGIDVNSQDLNGKTPLDYAYERGMKKTLGILLAHLQINTLSEDDKGKKPIDYFRPEPEPEPQFDLEPPLRTPGFFKPTVVEKPTPQQVEPKSWCYFL